MPGPGSSVSQAWLDKSVIAMLQGRNSDQYELQRLLESSDREERARLYRVYVSQDLAFMNYDGPNVKHFLRSNYTDWTGSEVSARLTMMKQVIDDGGLRDNLEDFNGLMRLFHVLR